MSAEVPISSSRGARLLAAAHDAFRRLEESLTGEERSWLEAVSPLRMIDALDAYPASAGLSVVSPGVQDVVDEVLMLGGARWAHDYVQIVRAQLLVRTLARARPYRLPPSVGELLGQEIERILAAARVSDSAKAFALDAQALLDVGLCRGAVLPFGFLFAQVPFRLSTRILAFGGLEDLPLEPWLGLHIPPPKEAYSRAWRERTYARIGEFLVANPAYHGAYGLAWVVDPAVAEISPHLAHVRELLHDGGAVMFPTDTADAATVENATSTSKTRRRLYEEGVYAPTDHALVWRRDDLIQWATTVTSDHA